MTERAKSSSAGSPKPGDPAPSVVVDAVLLLGRYGHQGAAGEGMEALAEAVRAIGRYPMVRTAVAERGLHSLPEGLEACVRAGVNRILVVPVFLGRDHSLIHWLSKAAYRWSRAQRKPGPEVVFAGAIGGISRPGRGRGPGGSRRGRRSARRCRRLRESGGSSRLVRDTAPRAARVRLPGTALHLAGRGRAIRALLEAPP